MNTTITLDLSMRKLTRFPYSFFPVLYNKTQNYNASCPYNNISSGVFCGSFLFDYPAIQDSNKFNDILSFDIPKSTTKYLLNRIRRVNYINRPFISDISILRINSVIDGNYIYPMDIIIQNILLSAMFEWYLPTKSGKIYVSNYNVDQAFNKIETMELEDLNRYLKYIHFEFGLCSENELPFEDIRNFKWRKLQNFNH